MQTYLKVKIKALAAEAAIIRTEERKQLGWARYCADRQEAHDKALSCYAGLHQHRVVDVRQEARAALLAYAFLRGRACAQVERHMPAPWLRERALRMIVKYGDAEKKAAESALVAWLAPMGDAG